MALIATRIQEVPFDISEEYHRFLQNPDPYEGAIVTFMGQKRSEDGGNKILSLTIEHYPNMAEKLLSRLAENIVERFSLTRLTIIHRVGYITGSEPIVLVLTAASHRQEAFLANQEIINQLKTELPFWKKETTAESSYWLDSPD